MNAKSTKATTESAAAMEARIRAEVEARIKADVEAEMRQKIEAEVRAKIGGKMTRAQAKKELADFITTLPEKPRYQLTEKAYIDDIMWEPDNKPWVKDSDPPVREPLIIPFMGRPGPHMVPKNKAAEMMYAKFPPSNANPIDELSIVGDEGTAALKLATAVG